MKSIPLSIGFLVLSAISAAYGQDKASATDATTNSVPKQASFIGLDGTDLKIGSLPPITFHGFASQGYLKSTDYNYLGDTKGSGSGQFNEVGLNATMSPFPHTRIAAQAFTFDLGDVGEHELMLDYGLVDYNFCDQFGIRGGRVRRPMGIYNHIQDVDLSRTFVLLPQGLYDARFRDFSASLDGGTIYGEFRLGKAGSLSYEGYAGVFDYSKEGGIAQLLKYVASEMPPGTEFNSVKGGRIFGYQLWWNTPIEGLRAGGSMADVPDNTANFTMFHAPFRQETSFLIQQYSLEYVWRSWTFQSEYRNIDNSSWNYMANMPAGDSHVQGDSWYVGGAYRFNKLFEAGTYYTEDYGDINNRDGHGKATPSDSYQKDWALAFRFDPKPWWTVKLEGHLIHGTALLNQENPDRNGNAWYMLALKTTFSF